MDILVVNNEDTEQTRYRAGSMIAVSGNGRPAKYFTEKTQNGQLRRTQ